MRSLVTIYLIAALSGFSGALLATTNEFDLSGKGIQPYSEASSYDFFRPDEVKTTKIDPGKIGIKMILNTKEGKQRKVSGFSHRFYFGGKFHVVSDDTPVAAAEKCQTDPGREIHVATLLEHPLFAIENHNEEEYEILFKARCGQMTTLIFDWDSYGGQALGVMEVALKAVRKFTEMNRLNFWNEKLRIVYRSNGNFFDFEKVHVTDGYKWDIVGHEFGHGIYHMGKVGRGAAGVHYIDRCYGENIAFSEGWASFFSAWLELDLESSNPAFPYMVPRRAPLAIETVPADVCKGPGNEWRVFSFLWDLIDRHNDGESSRMSFLELWDFTRNKEYTGLTQLKDDLLASGYDPLLINLVWDQTVMGRL